MAVAVLENEKDRRSYTAKELRDNADKLPGFLSETAWGPHLAEKTLWQFVGNFVVPSISLDPDGKPDIEGAGILAATRKEKPHFNTLSTPTIRMTHRQAKDIMIGHKRTYLKEACSFRLDEANPMKPERIAAYRPNLELLTEPSSLAFLTMDLLRQKLGFLALASKEPGTVSLSNAIAGFSYVGDDKKTNEPKFEPLIMLGSVVAGLGNSFILAPETNDYRRVSLTSLSRFGRNVREKDVKELSPSATPEDVTWVCVMGLCLAISAWMVSDPENILHHAGAGHNAQPLYRSPFYTLLGKSRAVL